MGAAFNKSLKPEELAEFKKLPSDTLLDHINIPEREENRVPTDRKFLIVFGVTVIILLPFLIYTLVYSDMGRFFGYDQCGNVCGRTNTKYDQWSCTGKDLTNEKYLKYEGSRFRTRAGQDITVFSSRQCVRDCGSDSIPIFGICTPMETSSMNIKSDEAVDVAAEEISQFLKKAAWRITLACFLSLGITMIMIFLFRTATALMVWSILGGVVILGIGLVAGMWFLYFRADSMHVNPESKKPLLYTSVILTIFLLILLCVMVFMFKKIQLVILLLKEASKAAFAMPLLIFVPILTFFVELAIVVAMVTTSLYIYTSGVLTQLTPQFLIYQENVVMVFTGVFNFWMAFWGIQFISGIQYMVIAGAVSKWYFAKNKDHLEGPIATSASIAFKYHLGTVAFGSLVITLMAIVRSLLSSLTKNKNVKICVDFCMESLETLLKFLSKNSYILTAMHGKPFFKSGKRAAKIIFQNAVNIAAVNYVGDFVLFMAQLLIVIISMLITVGLMKGADGDHAWAVYIIIFIVSLSIAVTFFSMFETIIDTIFLCFCEDSLLNDGMARPYAMTRDLMEFVENSKKIYGEKKN